MAAYDIGSLSNRVTQIIADIPDDVLEPLLPRSIDWQSMRSLPTVNFPVWGYQDTSKFGLFVDLLIRIQIYCKFPDMTDISKLPEHEQVLFTRANSGSWKDIVPDLGYHAAEISQSWSLFNKFNTDITSCLQSLSGESKIIVGAEYQHPLGVEHHDNTEDVQDETLQPILALLSQITNGGEENVMIVCCDDSGNFVDGAFVDGTFVDGSQLSRSSPAIQLPSAIQGHPDIVWIDRTEGLPDSYGVIDIKAVRKPSTNCVKHMTQVCSYAALMREDDKVVDYIGIHYPLQKHPAVIFSLDPDWDHSRLLSFLSSKCVLNYIPHLRIPFMSGVGHHVHGCSQLLKSINNDYGRPIQFYMTPRTGQFPNYDVAEIKRVLTQNCLLPCFIHGPLFINLCKPQTAKYPDPIHSLGAVIRELEYGHDWGLSGVVLHVGKNVEGFPFDRAFDKMKYYTLWCVVHAKEDCPVLLETPAGQGTEMLVNVDDFCSFYEEILLDYPNYYRHTFDAESSIEAPSGSQPKAVPFGLCLDTCHIYSSGQHLPYYFSRVALRLGPKVIKLVHFNDSRTPFGSKVDRHAPIGMGSIPHEELKWVHAFCTVYGIPMVTE